MVTWVMILVPRMSRAWGGGRHTVAAAEGSEFSLLSTPPNRVTSRFDVELSMDAFVMLANEETWWSKVVSSEFMLNERLFEIVVILGAGVGGGSRGWGGGGGGGMAVGSLNVESIDVPADDWSVVVSTNVGWSSVLMTRVGALLIDTDNASSTWFDSSAWNVSSCFTCCCCCCASDAVGLSLVKVRVIVDVVSAMRPIEVSRSIRDVLLISIRFADLDKRSSSSRNCSPFRPFKFLNFILLKEIK